MAEDSQVIPLAPVRINQENEELPTIKPISLVQPKSSKFLVYMLSIVVILSIVMLIFGLTIRISSPEVRFKPVEINNLRYGTTTTTPLAAPSLDMDMVAEIRVDNTNFGPFKFHNSSYAVFYGNVTIGVTYINGGHVNTRGSKRMNVTVQVRSNELLNNNANFSGDIGSRLVPLGSYMELKGEVPVLKIINGRRTAFMNCTMTLNLTSQAFRDLRCN